MQSEIGGKSTTGKYCYSYCKHEKTVAYRGLKQKNAPRLQNELVAEMGSTKPLPDEKVLLLTVSSGKTILEKDS